LKLGSIVRDIVSKPIELSVSPGPRLSRRKELAMRLTISAFAFCALVAAPTAAGAVDKTKAKPKDESVLQFSSHTALVLVPVIVHHKDKHVGGLKKEDFTVYEDGKPKPIESFEEIKSAAFTKQLERRINPSQTEFTNVDKTNPTARLTIIALRAGDYHGKTGVLSFLKQGPLNEPVAILSVGDGVRLIHDFSSDPVILAAALEGAWRGIDDIDQRGEDAKAKSDSPVRLRGATASNSGAGDTGSAGAAMKNAQDAFSQSEARFEELEYAATQCGDVAAVRALARSLASTPGRKSLVWVAGAGPLPVPTSFNNPCYFQTNEALLELASANMAIYTVDTRGLMAPVLFDHPGNTGLLGRHSTSHENLGWSADATGGRAFFNSNDLSGLLAKVDEDSTEYYQLTYRLNPLIKPGWHKIKVEVDHPGVEVRTRSGFLTRKEKPAADADELKRALSSPFMQTEIPVLLSWQGQAEGSAGSKRITFRVSVPGSSILVDDGDRNHVSISLTAVARSAKDRIAIVNKDINGHLTLASLSKFSSTGVNYKGEFEVPAGRYEIKFAVRDNVSGKVGTVIAALDAK
jgi:VWFA-related protein